MPVTEEIETVIIVGLPDASVKESKERVSAALYSIGFPVVDSKVVINLSPAEQKKNGPLFDLPIAIGILKELKRHSHSSCLVKRDKKAVQESIILSIEEQTDRKSFTIMKIGFNSFKPSKSTQPCTR